MMTRIMNYISIALQKSQQFCSIAISVCDSMPCSITVLGFSCTAFKIKKCTLDSVRLCSYRRLK